MKWILGLITLIVVIGVIFVAYEIHKIWRVLPSEQQIQEHYKAVSLDKNNKFVRLNELPTHVYNAFLAAENSNYLENGSSMSDCTWVIIKNIFGIDMSECDDAIFFFTSTATHPPLLTSTSRMPRYFERFLYAWKLEGALKPEGVLELFLNEAYFGSMAFGISSATKTYFDKQPKEITVAQSALLAGLLKAPSRYNLTKNPEQAKERRDLILQKMQTRGMISNTEFDSAIKAELFN